MMMIPSLLLPLLTLLMMLEQEETVGRMLKGGGRLDFASK